MRLPNIKLKKLGETGDHVVAIVVFVALFGIAGTFFLLHENAQSYVEVHIGGQSGACLAGTTVQGCNSSNKNEAWVTLSGSNFHIQNQNNQCLDDWNGKVGTNASNRLYMKTNTCYSGDKNQEWNWSTTYNSTLKKNIPRLKNVASGGCINGLGGSTGAGSDLIIYTCNTQNNESFYESSISSGGGNNGGGGSNLAGEAGQVCKDAGINSSTCNNVAIAVQQIVNGYGDWVSGANGASNNYPQLDCLGNLWERESGWSATAYNAGSGAYGIPQSLPGSKMASAGSDWQTNPATQIKWGLGYIKTQYGTPCAAWSHEVRVGWYVQNLGADGTTTHS